jgi:hypothetical protein
MSQGYKITREFATPAGDGLAGYWLTLANLGKRISEHADAAKLATQLGKSIGKVAKSSLLRTPAIEMMEAHMESLIGAHARAGITPYRTGLSIVELFPKLRKADRTIESSPPLAMVAHGAPPWRALAPSRWLGCIDRSLGRRAPLARDGLAVDFAHGVATAAALDTVPKRARAAPALVEVDVVVVVIGMSR